VNLYQKACSLGAYNACTSYGFMFEKGHGVSRDYGKAMAFYEKGCTGGNPQGCSNVGVMYETGMGMSSADLGRAGEYYEKACKMGLNEACSYLTQLIDHMRRDCEPPKPAARPAKPGEKVDKSDCTNLGYLYELGVGVPKDMRMAAEYYKRGCDGKSAVSCSNLGILYENGRAGAPDEKKAVELYKKSCDLGGASGCNNYGFATERGKGVRADPKKALDLYRKACDLGSQRGCENVKILVAQMGKKTAGFIEIPAANRHEAPSGTGLLNSPGASGLGVRR
jgi:TPR repeat protein